MRYLVPKDLPEAIMLRQQTGFPLLAGGTDLYPAFENGLRTEGLIDISRLAALRNPIRCERDAWIIPALSTWTDVIRADLPSQFTVLKQAARQIGGPQIQNTGTVGGNVCNASPAADGTAALLALDAAVVLVGASGERRMPLIEFVCGNRRTALEPGEVLHSIRVPACSGRHASTFKKLGARRYLVISIVMLGVLVELDAQRRVHKASIAVGACADRALRLTQAEQRMVGCHLQDLRNFGLSDADLAVLSPIDDVRATATFRRHAVGTLLEDAMCDLATELMR